MKDQSIARASGALYVTIIALGLTAEVAVRQPLLAAAGPLADWETPLRLAIAADAVMVAADIALAYLLWRLLVPAGQHIAAIAALFRLAQAAVIAAQLSTQYDAVLWIANGEPDLARHAMQIHAAGYDFGLIFFGINAVLTGLLLIRHTDFPSWLGGLLGAAGLVYLTGSTLRLLAPGWVETFAPAYLIAVVAETAFAVVLIKGRRPRVSNPLETSTGRFNLQRRPGLNGG